jgi:uncharacterized membrane protein YgcG
MAAAPNVGIPIRTVARSVESFEGRAVRRRERLAPSEEQLVRYVFVDWAADCGARSVWSITVESAAKKRAGGQGSRVSSEIGATMHVAPSHSLGVDDLFPQERWCSGRAQRRSSIIRCWRSLREVGEHRPLALVVLYRLYGDRPPGDRGANPFESDYGKDMAGEYALVAEFAGEGEAWAEWQATLRGLKSDRPARGGEGVGGGGGGGGGRGGGGGGG